MSGTIWTRSGGGGGFLLIENIRNRPIVKEKKKTPEIHASALAIARAGHVRREENANVPGEEPGRRGPRRDYKIFLGDAISNMVFESRPRRFFPLSV